MKQVTYEMRGLILEVMIPAITASCESLEDVQNARVLIDGTDTARLILVMEDHVDPVELEYELDRIIQTKGLVLKTPFLDSVPCEAPAKAPEEEQPSKDPEQEQPAQGATIHKDVLPKRERKVSLVSAVSAVIVAVVLSILATTAVTTMLSDRGGALPEAEKQESFEQLDVIDRLFRQVSVLKVPDQKTLLTTVLKTYVAATGDRYAEYFTAEEYAELNSTQNGEMCGIGINVVNGHATVDGVEYQVITVVNVTPDSPAEEAGVQIGDHIMYVGKGEDKILVQNIGYTEALNRMRGEEGTELSVILLRAVADGGFEEVEITAIREKMTSRSVIYRKYAVDPTVGILRITGFDHTTRDQFIEGIEALKKEGCTRFVFDLRNNPGGLLDSVEDVLILFLQEGDTVISIKDVKSMKDEDSKGKVTKIGVNEKGMLTCGSHELTREDIGKYRDLEFSVLVNGYSASAAELFTANMRDHELGRIVGTKTYGKGSMQTTYPLSRYGFDGALKLTSAYYFPPSGVGYDGVGITPHVEVELSEEAQTYNINLLPDHLDNQLTAAVAELTK